MTVTTFECTNGSGELIGRKSAICGFVYHDLHVGDKRLSCPACGGKGSLVFTTDANGRTLVKKDESKRTTLREFFIALFQYCKFKLIGGK